MLFKNNLTFAVLVTDGGWRTDLTARFCEYHSYKINGSTDNIMVVDSIDQALQQCQTDYLLVQSGGHLTFRPEFFHALNDCVEEGQDIFLGHIVLAEDYLLLDKQCLFVNMKLWRAHGSIAFEHKVLNGPNFKVTIESKDQHRPAQIEVAKDRTSIPSPCIPAGAGLIVKQLDTFGTATSLNFLDSTHFHLLDLQTSLAEICSETVYEKLYLPKSKKEVFTIDTDKWIPVDENIIHTVVAPARGLKALNLAEHFKAKSVIVYDTNEDALELQHRIFSVKRPTLYGDIIRGFINDYPDATIIGDWQKDSHSVVTVFDGDVQFKNVDLFSFEIIQMIRQCDIFKSMLIDFSDGYTHPHNYYRRPLYQVQGLFAEVYSQLKSRPGPTHILGYAPGFQQLNTVKVNTDAEQFNFKPDVEAEVPEVYQSFKVEKTEKNIVEDKWTPPAGLTVGVIEPAEDTPFTLALTKGYSKVQHLDAINNLPTSKIMLVKEEVFEDFIAVFEYTFDENNRWSFKVGVPNNPKRIEFSNGLSLEGFKKHLLTEMKINPVIASRYFLNN
jgi:hypothetical protein